MIANDTADLESPALDSTAAVLSRAPAAAERRQSALLALGRRAIATSNALLLIQDAAALLGESLNADFTGVAELAADDEAFVVRLTSTRGAAGFEFRAGRGERECLAGHALRVGHSICVADLAQENSVQDSRLLQAGIHSAIVCPLKLHDRSFGTLGVYATSPHRFGPADELFVETISHLVTTSLAREHSERQLAAERAFAGVLLETVEALVLTLNPAGRLVRLNRAAERVTGFASDEVADRPVFNALVVPEELELMRAALEGLNAGQSPRAFASSILTKQGERRKIAWTFSIQRDPQGVIATILATGIDISEKCAAQAALSEARHETERLSAELRQERSQPAGARPFQALLDSPEADRRSKPRRAYPYKQLIAPLVGNDLPPRSAFQEVLCHDISASGFSFFAPRPPAQEFVMAAFGCGPALTYLTAQVVHCRRTADGSKFSVGCRYTSRVQY
jgi:PAS domain S-box-containing protein